MKTQLQSDTKSLNQAMSTLGYMEFFTAKGYEAYKDINFIPKQFAYQTNKHNVAESDPQAINEIKLGHFPGPMHWATTDFERKEGYKFFDLDMSEAYPRWLTNYDEFKLGYRVGGHKHYYKTYEYFANELEKDVKVYKFRFAIETSNALTSRLYRHWITKSVRTSNLIVQDTIISGFIFIPDIKDLAQRFLDDVQGYESYEIEIESIIATTGKNAVIINTANIDRYIQYKKEHKDPTFKQILNSSTGYLAIQDKLMYFVMVNHIRWVIFKLMDEIDEWNKDAPDWHIKYVASNTDGLTVYAKGDIRTDSMQHWLLDTVYKKTGFVIKIKDIYETPHITPNDIRKGE